MEIKVGDKLQIKNISFDIEICGFFPASQNKECVDMYNATLNGEPMKIKRSFIDNLLFLNEKAKADIPKVEKLEPKQEKIVVQKSDKKIGKKNKEK